MGQSFDNKAIHARSVRSSFLPSLAAVPLILLAVLLPPTVEGQVANLFAPVEEPPPPESPDETTLRSRVVTVDLGQLRRAQAAVAQPSGQFRQAGDASWPASTTESVPAPDTTLTLNLFNDTVVTAIVERTAPTFSGGYAVSGRLVEEPLGTLTMVVNGARVVGTIRTPAGTYRIRSAGAGLATVNKVEEPPFECGVGESHSETVHQP